MPYGLLRCALGFYMRLVSGESFVERFVGWLKSETVCKNSSTVRKWSPATMMAEIIFAIMILSIIAFVYQSIIAPAIRGIDQV